MEAAAIDPVELTQALIRCPSVTPDDAGAIGVLAARLEALGFTCHRLRFEAEGTPPIDNLYARIGNSGPNFCFAGHTDVVPVGRAESWSVDPFGGEILNDRLYGRGAADMKGAVAAFAAAAASYLGDHGTANGSLSLLITGDEEGPAINGTAKVLGWLAERGEKLDACLVGEPTSQTRLGDMIKIGRRGSLNGKLTVDGIQGHVAYPQLADNPLPRLIKLLSVLGSGAVDEGSTHFPPTNLELTTVDVGNPAVNIIPAQAVARFNFRFNDRFTGKSLEEWTRARLDSAGLPYELEMYLSGESFFTAPGALSDAIAGTCRDILGIDPDLSTTGGTSDARFIHRFCPVVEFGLVNQTMHKTDEHVAVSDIVALTRAYRAIIAAILGPR
jgi:succinyl-diaminopimelate desuccinylase